METKPVLQFVPSKRLPPYLYLRSTRQSQGEGAVALSCLGPGMWVHAAFCGPSSLEWRDGIRAHCSADWHLAFLKLTPVSVAGGPLEA